MDKGIRYMEEVAYVLQLMTLLMGFEIMIMKTT